MSDNLKIPRLVISIPCYNEEAVLEDTTNKLETFMDQLVADQVITSDSLILFSSNGSTDNTWPIIERLHQTRRYVSGIKLASNVGFQNNLMAGMTVAKDYGDVIVTMDADLQDDYTVIPEMIKHWQQGCDVVYGVRKERKTDTWFKRNTALAFYKFMNFLGVNTVYNHADFRLMSKRFVEEITKYRERNLFLRGLVPLIGYQSAEVYYNRKERELGSSKFSFSGLVNLALDGITSVSVKPVRMVFSLGMLFVLISLMILVYVIFQKIYRDVPLGWASIVMSIWFCTGVLLMGIGIIGEYIGKIYIEVKDRPRFNIEKKLI